MLEQAITYIATATESQGKLLVKVLASNSCHAQTIGRYETTDECKAAVAPLGQVTWVTPYRFEKERTAY